MFRVPLVFLVAQHLLHPVFRLGLLVVISSSPIILHFSFWYGRKQGLAKLTPFLKQTLLIQKSAQKSLIPYRSWCTALPCVFC